MFSRLSCNHASGSRKSALLHSTTYTAFATGAIWVGTLFVQQGVTSLADITTSFLEGCGDARAMRGCNRENEPAELADEVTVSSWQYSWLKDNVDSDPGDGNYKANNADIQLVTILYMDNQMD